MNLQESDASSWEYLGEGNLNIVIRYQGTDDIYKGKVLRIAKEDDSISKSDQNFSFTQQFSEKVIKPLLGSDYVLPLTSIRVTTAFLKAVAHRIEADRPDSRKKKRVDVSLTVAYLMKDLTHYWYDANIITIELKPKWGFKPMSISNLPKEHQIIKQTKCRFCMHSHYKGSEANQFCPLDLYSQDNFRRKKALDVLLYDSRLEKTLKLFLNGEKLSLNEDTKSKCLQTLFGYNKEVLLEDVLDKILESDPILQKLKQLQMHLDELGAHQINMYYTRHQEEVVQYDIEVWKDVISRFQERLNLFEKVIYPENEKEEKQKIYEFVLSMTFKDCSIMINIMRATENNTHNKCITMPDGELIQYDIKVVDVDVKTITKIPYWHQLDHDIVEHALKLNLEKNCGS